MSYEGYTEYLCENGHHVSVDAWSDSLLKSCPECQKSFKWIHHVDQTNGELEDCPGTFAAGIKEIGSDDKWHKDHYGNKFAERIVRYEPNSPEWKPVHNVSTRSVELDSDRASKTPD